MNGHFYDFFLAPLELFTLKRLRSKLLRHARGKTLEIGFGTGANFKYLPKNIEYIGIDPDEEMRSRAIEKAAQFHLEIHDGDAQKLNFEDSTFDTVVATLVFCSIPDPDLAIEEVYRVLKPGGQFLLLEHVRKNTPIMGWLLDHLTPFWKHIAGGCHLNRDPSKKILEVGFHVELVSTFWKDLGKIWFLKK